MAQPEIITLTARGLIADVRLHALDLAEFHVHSVILKMQSNFFFKFLDSVDNSTATGGRFKYEWITKVDDDGSWSLVAAKDGKIESQGMEKLGSSAAKSLRIFKMFIQALYDKPYSIASFADLDVLAEIADYYRALPAVSKTLTKAIMLSMENQVYINPCDVSETTARTALKFHHKELFRDSIISMAGNCGGLEDDACDFFTHDAVLQRITQQVRTSIDEAVINAHKGFVYVLMTSSRVRQKMSEISPDFFSMPSYYRNLYDHDWKANRTDVRGKVGPVLRNNLTFGNKEELVGSCECGNHFLCGVLKDENLPWDLEEEDW